MEFECLATDGHARIGQLRFPRGVVDTPAFMPVGTYGSVKGLDCADILTSGSRMILGNTLHLALRPGVEVISRFGGLHAFMGWTGPILTDSGGFQVMSLGALRTIDDEGVTFHAPVDGRLFRLTPERAVAIQEALGSDVRMVLDHCPAYPASPEEINASLARSILWAERSCRAHGEGGQALFGIVQGGVDIPSRLRSFEALEPMGFAGYAIGGLAVGEPPAERLAVLDVLKTVLPPDRPRYLMGVGKPADLVAAVLRGIDLFDCVLPTRNGRNAHLFTTRGVLRLRNARYRTDENPIDPDCSCPACQSLSRAYLHHLDRVGDPLALRLLSLHNLTYYQTLLAQLRAAIRAGQLASVAQEILALEGGGQAVP
ncbi:queuine tRNA-ribosyltransferase [mine drainage metagenome]|uniref:Queuine tRNA-ribosyltransferase n=1 Tax=mine drainage metagenome TaxID=410659 RepID=T1A6F6_9ZZZZ